MTPPNGAASEICNTKNERKNVGRKLERLKVLK